MEKPDFKRKLAAIFHADVKGYSRLMGEDEEATLRTLTSHLETMVELIQQHQGRVVGAEGDAVLAEFSSVVDAVRCAVEVQKTLKEKNDALPENRRMEFRIGINLGDVIAEGDQIYGDGVNIAARIESLADGGGISVSETVYGQIVGKLDLTYKFQGEQAVKNIKKPVKVYRILADPEMGDRKRRRKNRRRPRRWLWAGLVLIGVVGFIAGTLFMRHTLTQPATSLMQADSLLTLAFPLPEKPSIAVLPFDNLSGNSDQEYLADGISENIITALSIIPELFVIARNSTFVYKGQPVKVQQVSEDLGVKYILEGSVQKSADRIRVTAQLIDGTTGHHLWGERYDRDLTDLFDLQDEITLKILTALQIELTEGKQSRKRPVTNNFEAWGLTVKGTTLFERFSREDNRKARDLFELAADLDPNYALAWTMLAWTHVIDTWLGFSESPAESIQRATELANKSAALNEDQSDIHSLLSSIHLMKKQYDAAITEGEEAVALGPNNALSHVLLSNVMLLSGNFDKAVSLAERAIRLAPYCADWELSFLAQAYRQAGQYEEAYATYKKTLERSKTNNGNLFFGLVGLVDVSVQLGREEKARTYAAELIKAIPNFSLEDFRQAYHYKNPEHLERILVNLRQAGLPETSRLKIPEKPSIAVLPFVNMSNDPSQEYFSDGMTEDLITDLSKISHLFVIARNSVFSYKGKSVKVDQIGRELGVRYVLEGSVRKAGDRVRITAQLIDAHTGGHIWAERYDRDLKDIFMLQDEVTRKIVAALVVKLSKDEEKRLVRRGTDSVEAYDLALRGADLFTRFTKADNTQARQMFKQAIDLDPKYAEAYSGLGWTYWMAWAFEWSMDPQSLDRALKLAHQALTLDESMPKGLTLVGKIYLWQKQHDRAIAELKKNIALNPNDADGIAGLGEALQFAGKPDEAVVLFKKAIRLNPIPPVWYYHGLGSAYFMSGQYDEAIISFKRVLNRNPNFWPAHIYLTAIYGERKEDEKARAEATEVLRVVPNFSLEASKAKLPYKDPAVFNRLGRVLGRAGLK